jgi:hypothetical protein
MVCDLIVFLDSKLFQERAKGTVLEAQNEITIFLIIIIIIF